MKISEIYDRYNIQANLQLHMYRVAAVGQSLVAGLDKEIVLDKNVVTTVLLLHDMGNIIKFDLKPGNIFTAGEIEYWKKIQQETIVKYGSDEHEVTLMICKEIGVSPQILDILKNIGSSKIDPTLESSDWYQKICSYADFRVAPYGVVSVTERFDDVLKRYKDRDHVLADQKKTEEKKRLALLLESQIQKRVVASLSLIDDKKIMPLLHELPDFVVN